MEKVITYLQSQPEITQENINKFQEEVTEYDKNHIGENIWMKISKFIDESGDNNDDFLRALEEDYKDLSLCLFMDQNAILNDFEDSEDNLDSSEQDRQLKHIPQQQNSEQSEAELRPIEHENMEIEKEIPQEEVQKEEDEEDDNIYDDEEDHIQDRSARRQNGEDSEENSIENEGSYDPLNTNNINFDSKNPSPNKGQVFMKNGLKFISNPKFNKTFDPRIMNNNSKAIKEMMNDPLFQLIKKMNPATLPVLNNMQGRMVPNAPGQIFEMNPVVQQEMKK